MFYILCKLIKFYKELSNISKGKKKYRDIPSKVLCLINIK